MNNVNIGTDNADDASSGSSVEEEVDSEPESPETNVVAEIGSEQAPQRLEDFAYLDERRQTSDFDEVSEDSDWDVDDEDWELANGGKLIIDEPRLTSTDFTKQYNRLRQQHNAQTPQAGPSSTRLDQRPAAPVKAPLPARNLNVAKDSGVALNPKSVSRATTKDKSDRATQEQVLDPRTRLVLSGLVNRGIVGEIERCISTGKEVSRSKSGWS
jgi:RIO kinase 1